jgi:hypothetical protein
MVFKIDADPVGGAPDDMTITLGRLQFESEREIVGDTDRAWNL